MDYKDFNIQKPKELPKCEKCNDTGIVKDPNGRVHTCWDCLQNGRLDVHSKDSKTSGLRI